MILHTMTRSAALAALIALALPALPAAAQTPPPLAPTNPNLDCPNPASQPLIMPPEIVRDAANKVLKGTIILSEEFQRLPTSTKGKNVTCAPQIVRTFRADGAPPTPPAQKPVQGYNDPIPGPTLRARVGDLIQLGFVNEVNSNRFDRNIDIDACTSVGQGGGMIRAAPRTCRPTACMPRAPATSTSTAPTPTRTRPVTTSSCRSARCRATTRAT